MASPNYLKVAWSIVRSLQRIEPPRPGGTGSVDHPLLEDALRELAEGGTSALPAVQPVLTAYLEKMRNVDPDALTSDGAKAFWLNLYNAGALQLAGTALAAGEDSVLRVPGAFQAPFVEIAGVPLSLDDVEHAKVRRFGDPRIHAALVCGSVSCPTLRSLPYEARGLSEQLDDQMRFFLANGGAVVDRAEHTIHLSRIFGWFGSDFVRPDRMPTFVPSRSRSVLRSIRPWLEGEAESLAGRAPSVRYQPYDWGLRCAVA